MVFGGVYGLNIKLNKFFTHGRNLVLDFNSSLSSDFTVSINFNTGVSGMREIVKKNLHTILYSSKAGYCSGSVHISSFLPLMAFFTLIAANKASVGAFSFGREEKISFKSFE
jgi:hypothetical protein